MCCSTHWVSSSRNAGRRAGIGPPPPPPPPPPAVEIAMESAVEPEPEVPATEQEGQASVSDTLVVCFRFFRGLRISPADRTLLARLESAGEEANGEETVPTAAAAATAAAEVVTRMWPEGVDVVGRIGLLLVAVIGPSGGVVAVSAAPPPPPSLSGVEVDAAVGRLCTDLPRIRIAA